MAQWSRGADFLLRNALTRSRILMLSSLVPAIVRNHSSNLPSAHTFKLYDHWEQLNQRFQNGHIGLKNGI
ncbi:unnamed protein product [Caenorhabditis nigoni]